VARKSTVYKAPARIESWKNEVCDDCGNGKWNNIYWNLDFIEHKPITLRCPFFRNGEVGIIRGTKACYHFCKKTQDVYMYDKQGINKL
jgi:hypothetical protein